jgi:ankyrin repeat protein
MNIQRSHRVDSRLPLIRLSIVAIVLLCLCGCGSRDSVHNAAHEGTLVTVKNWIEKGGDVNLKHSYSGNNLLSYAAGGGNVELVEYLISKGADIADKTGNSATPLHYACRNGHDRVVSYLISKGANPNAKADRYQRSYTEKLEGTARFPYEGTPLHWVIASDLLPDRKIVIVRLLLDSGAEPRALLMNPINGLPYSPISIAKGRHLTEIVDLLEAREKTNR